METRVLGSTGLEVSAIGLGGHLFPEKPVDYYPGFYGRRFLEGEFYEKRLEIIEEALRGGVNLFAADFEYECRALGRALKEIGARDRVLLSTVVEFRPERGARIKWDKLEKEIDRLLVLLNTDRIDLPQIRTADWHVEENILADMAGLLAGLAEKGKIGVPAFYSSDNDVNVLITGLRQGLFKVVLRAMGLLNPTAYLKVLPEVVKADAGFIGFVPFQKGRLFDCGFEAGLGADSIAGAGINWVMDQEGVSGLLCGASNPEELAMNIDRVNNPLPELELKNILAGIIETNAYDAHISELQKEAGHLVLDWRKSDPEGLGC